MLVLGKSLQVLRQFPHKQPTKGDELNGGQNVINYVDLDPSFKGHCWCVEGVKKPGKINRSIYFFLSGWPTQASSTLVSAADESEIPGSPMSQ